VAAALGYGLNVMLTPAEVADWGWRVPFFIGLHDRAGVVS